VQTRLEVTSSCGGPAPKAATRVAASTPSLSIQIYSRELPLGSQSHSRISSLCVCARVPFVYEPSGKANSSPPYMFMWSDA